MIQRAGVLENENSLFIIVLTRQDITFKKITALWNVYKQI